MSYFSRRSASVRVEASHGQRRRPTSSPPFKRSASVSSSIEIGAKGSIFSLIGRDLSHDTDLSSTTDSHENHHGKLSSAHHGSSDPHSTALHNQNKKPVPSSSLSSEIVGESIQKLPKWKRVLNRLIRGGLLRKGKEKDKKMKKKKKEELSNVSEEKKTETNRLTQQEQHSNGNTAYQDSAAKSTTSPSTANPTSSSSSSCLEPSLSQQTSPIWERRNFSEIKPLNVPRFPATRKAQKHQ